jgi:hypothetical protein
MAVNTQLVQADCFTMDEASWMIIPKTDDSSLYLIQNLMGNYYLDNYGNIATNGNGIYSWTKHGLVQQDWQLVPLEDPNYVKIVSAGTSKCVDVTDSGVGNNVLIRQWECTGADSQAFAITKTPVPKVADGVPVNRWVQIVNSASGKCIRFKGSGVKLQLDECGGTHDFVWDISMDEVDGSYFIASRVGNYLIDNYANVKDNGNGIYGWARHGGIQQHWYFKSQEESGTFSIVTRGTNKCIDLPSTTSGVEVREWDCSDSNANQIFSFVVKQENTVPSSVPLNSWVQIVNKGNGNCLKFNGQNVNLVHAACGTSDEFLWNPSWNSADNTFFFTSKKGNYLMDNYANGQANGNGIFGWDRHGGIQQNFIVTTISDDYVQLTTKGSPKCVTIQSTSQYIIQYDCSQADNQLYQLKAVQSEINTQATSLTYKWVKITNKASGKCIRYNLSGTQIQSVDCYNSQEYQWNLAWNSWDNSYFISNAVTDNLQGYLFDNYANIATNGNGIYSWIRHGLIQQHWFIKSIDSTYYNFVTKGTSKCIQLKDGSTANNALYIQSDCDTSDDSEAFSFEEVPYPLPKYQLPQTQWVQIASKATGKCLKYNGDLLNLIQTTCDTTDEFYFNFSWDSWDGTYFITSKKSRNTLFDNYGNGQADGNGIFTWTRHGLVQQHWFLKDYEESGYFRIVAKGSAKCITIPNADTKDGALIQQWACQANADEQAWNFQGYTVTASLTISGYIKDATNNNLISNSVLTANNLKIVFLNADTNVEYTATLDGSIYTVTLPAGNYKRTDTMDGYSTSTTNIVFSESSDESNSDNTIFFSAVISGYRIVLTWASIPKDLDSHLILPSGSEIYYRTKTNSDGTVKLDVDNKLGYGPETVTINSDAPTGTYKYYVLRYTSDGRLIDSSAKVVVYHGDNQIKEYLIPTDQAEAKKWYVFNVDLETNTITDVNTISA